MIGNVYTLIKTVLILLLIFHIFACCWIYIGSNPDGWRNITEQYRQDDPIYVYITAFYFVTTSATTIGYGDYHGSTS